MCSPYSEPAALNELSGPLQGCDVTTIQSPRPSEHSSRALRDKVGCACSGRPVRAFREAGLEETGTQRSVSARGRIEVLQQWTV